MPAILSTSNALDRFASTWPILVLLDGEEIKVEQTADVFIRVVEGAIGVGLENELGLTMTAGIAARHSMFELCPARNGDAARRARAIGPSVVAIAPVKAVYAACADDLYLLECITHHMAAWHRLIEDRTVWYATYPIRKRVADVLVACTIAREDPDTHDMHGYSIDIATLIELVLSSQTTVRAVLRDFHERKWIEIQHHRIVITDPVGLQRACGAPRSILLWGDAPDF
jgi:CRP-like cAMP-binding protein